MKHEHGDQVRGGVAPRAGGIRHPRAAGGPPRGERQPGRWQTWRAPIVRSVACLRPVLCVVRR